MKTTGPNMCRRSCCHLLPVSSQTGTSSEPGESNKGESFITMLLLFFPICLLNKNIYMSKSGGIIFLTSVLGAVVVF